MALELPSALADVLEGLGYHWTNTDEGGLSAMGEAWTNFSAKPQTHGATANFHAQTVFASNQGQGIDAMNTVWSQDDAAHRNLVSGGSAAALIGAGLQICAGIVVVLKANVIIQLVQLLIEIASAIAEAFETFGASLLEIPIFKELTQKAIGLIQNTAINAVMASA
jgi:hypothetical protein